MATLKAHGAQVGMIEFLRYKKSWMSDGKILKNYGFGWKLVSQLKAGIEPQAAFQRAVEFKRQRDAEYPCCTAFHRAMIQAAPISKRWKLVEAIQLMPDDPDGVWSEVSDGCGDNLDLSVDEIVDLCRLYKAAEIEVKSMKAEQQEG